MGIIAKARRNNQKKKVRIGALNLRQIGCVLVPIYPTISVEDYHFILSNCEAKCIFVDTESLLKKVKGVLVELPEIKDVVMFSNLKSPEEFAELAAAKSIIPFDELLQLGLGHPNPDTVQAIKDSIQTRDVATMIYTSGTTGFPKGVMLCHENIFSVSYCILFSFRL